MQDINLRNSDDKKRFEALQTREEYLQFPYHAPNGSPRRWQFVALDYLHWLE